MTERDSLEGFHQILLSITTRLLYFRIAWDFYTITSAPYVYLPYSIRLTIASFQTLCSLRHLSLLALLQLELHPARPKDIQSFDDTLADVLDIVLVHGFP